MQCKPSTLIEKCCSLRIRKRELLIQFGLLLSQFAYKSAFKLGVTSILQIWIRMFLGLPDLDLLVWGTDPDPSIIKQKIVGKNFNAYCSVTSSWLGFKKVISKSSVADPGCLSRIPDPDFHPSRIPDPKTTTKKRGEKNLLSYLFL